MLTRDQAEERIAEAIEIVNLHGVTPDEFVKAADLVDEAIGAMTDPVPDAQLRPLRRVVTYLRFRGIEEFNR